MIRGQTAAVETEESPITKVANGAKNRVEKRAGLAD